MRNLLFSNLTFFLVMILVTIHYYLWIDVVGAFPSENGHYNFYSPMGSYLYLSKHLPDHNMLMSLFPDKFPQGIGIALTLISSLGLVDLFLYNPWIIFFPVLMIIGLIAWLSEAEVKNKILVLLGLYFFPIAQLTLKSFSLHCIIIYFFLFIVIYVNYDKPKWAISKYLTFTLFAFVCMALKHLGVVLVLCYAATLFVCYLHKKESLNVLILCAFVSGLLAIPFYLTKSTTTYSYTELALHNPYLSSNIKILLPFLLLYLLSTLLLYMYSKKSIDSRLKAYPKIFSSPFSLVFFLVLLMPFFFILDLQIFFFYGMGLSFSLFTCGLYLALFYSSEGATGVYSTLFFLTYSCGAFLFGTRFAITGDIYFFSLILMSYMFFKQCSSFSKKIIVISFYIVVSSFSPNHEALHEILGDASTNFYQYYVDGFHQNPLSWQQSEVLKDRKIIQKVLQKKELTSFVDSSFTGFVNIHPFQFQVLELLGEEQANNPYIQSLTFKLERGKINAFKDFLNEGEKLFSTWIEQKKFLHFVYSDKNVMVSPNDFTNKEACIEFLNNVSLMDFTEDYTLRVEVAVALQNAFYFWLQKTKGLNRHYDYYKLGKFGFYILKDIPLKNTQQSFKPYSALVDSYLEKVELKKILLKKGRKYFDNELLKAKQKYALRCNESKVLCQALHEPIVYFTIDTDAKNKVVAIEKQQRNWGESESELKDEYLKFAGIFAGILNEDLRLAESMMVIAERKFSDRFALQKFRIDLNNQLENDAIISKSIELWIEANVFLDLPSPNFKEAHRLLEKALLLNPNSENIKKDYELAAKNLD